MRAYERFFQEIDRSWRGPRDGRITLRVIGSAALMLQTDYARGTNDGDVLETASVTGDILPFLPHVRRWHALPDLDGTLRVFEVEVLDVVDVVVSKRVRFHAADQSDVKAMVDRDLVPHAVLVERFRSAVDAFSADARAEDLPRYVRNLHRVERDLLGVAESDIELPAWVSDE